MRGCLRGLRLPPLLENIYTTVYRTTLTVPSGFPEQYSSRSQCIRVRRIRPDSALKTGGCAYYILYAKHIWFLLNWQKSHLQYNICSLLRNSFSNQKTHADWNRHKYICIIRIRVMNPQTWRYLIFTLLETANFFHLNDSKSFKIIHTKNLRFKTYAVLNTWTIFKCVLFVLLHLLRK